MNSSQSQENNPDYYTVNEDYIGTRVVNTDKSEDVAFHDNSSIRIWYNEQVVDFAPHWHNALEIIMPIENYYDVIVEDSNYHLMPEEILIIPPGNIHELLAPSFGKRFIFLFDISHLTGLKGFSGIQSQFTSPLHMTNHSYPDIYNDIHQMLLQIENEYFCRNEYAELIIHSILINIYVKFGYNHINTANLFPNVRKYKQKEYVHKFNNLLDYLDKHYMDDLSLENIADSIGFSKYHFSRLFKQYTNFTFCDYLSYRRIKAAEELLIQSDLSITEIAMQIGFSSISTFNRIFKQQKNCTPREYQTKNCPPDFRAIAPRQEH